MSTSASLNALTRWRDELEKRADLPMWWVRTDGPVGIIYTVDSKLEDITVARACVADRYHFEMRPTTHEGIRRFDLVPSVEAFSADEGTMRDLAAILAHNRIHGTLRRAGTEGEERF